MAVERAVLAAINERLKRGNRELAAENLELRRQVVESQQLVVELRFQLAQSQSQLLLAQAQLKQSQSELALAQSQLAQALKRIEELERSSHRQSAPFRRKKKGGTGQPGRKPGFRGTYRRPPPQIDHEVEVPLEIRTCPDCQSPLDRRPLTQLIEEIPPIRPEVTRLTTWHATCPCCQKQWHSEHELQVSSAQGAAGVHLGPRATALATILKSHFGLPLGRVAGVLERGFGLSISRGGLSHLLHRMAKKAQPAYEELLEKIRGSRAVHADETSWYVGQPKYWLWVFTTPQYTLYHVDESRGRAVAEKILGSNFPGVLITDCAAAYAHLPYKQHKCIPHHLRRLSEFREREDTLDTTYLDTCEQFWKQVIALSQARLHMDVEEYAAEYRSLKARLEILLTQPVQQIGDRKFQTRMKNAQPHLLGCLEHHVEASNNRAERAIRPAVIARKLSCGNKTAHGAQTWEILVSHCTTLYQQGQDLVASIGKLATLDPMLVR
jgi:transposase